MLARVCSSCSACSLPAHLLLQLIARVPGSRETPAPTPASCSRASAAAFRQASSLVAVRGRFLLPFLRGSRAALAAGFALLELACSAASWLLCVGGFRARAGSVAARARTRRLFRIGALRRVHRVAGRCVGCRADSSIRRSASRSSRFPLRARPPSFSISRVWRSRALVGLAPLLQPQQVLREVQLLLQAHGTDARLPPGRASARAACPAPDGCLRRAAGSPACPQTQSRFRAGVRGTSRRPRPLRGICAALRASPR